MVVTIKVESYENWPLVPNMLLASEDIKQKQNERIGQRHFDGICVGQERLDQKECGRAERVFVTKNWPRPFNFF